MVDIVEKLRDTTGIHEDLLYEAADLIESLREQLAESQFDFRAVFDISTKRENKIERLDQEIKSLKRNIDFVIVDGMAFKSFTLIYKDDN